MTRTILTTLWAISVVQNCFASAQNFQFSYLNFDSASPVPGTLNPVYNPFQLTGITPYNATGALLPLVVGGIFGTPQIVGVKPRSGTNVGAYNVFSTDAATGLNRHYIRRIDSGKFGVDSFCIGCGALSGISLAPPPAVPCRVTVSCKRTETDGSPFVWTGNTATGGLLSVTAAYVMSDRMRDCIQLDWTTEVDQAALVTFLSGQGISYLAGGVAITTFVDDLILYY